MDWTSVDLSECPLIRALGVVGARWTLPVLRETLNGVHRFEDVQAHLGISPSVLTQRLTEMVEQGLLERIPYREEGTRQRHGYQPTAKAWALYPVLAGLTQWGEQYLPGPEVPPVRLVESATGKPIVVGLVPEGTPVCSPAEVRVLAGDAGSPN